MGDKTSEQESKTNFHLFMDELVDALQNVLSLISLSFFLNFYYYLAFFIKGELYSKLVYENILSQEVFLKNLNEVVRAVQREGGVRDKKVIINSIFFLYFETLILFFMIHRWQN